MSHFARFNTGSFFHHLRLPATKGVVLLLPLLFFIASCTNQQRSRLAVTPSSYGKVDNLMVVADNYNWTTTIGDTFRNAFEALYPVTPQPESLYDLRFKTPKEFRAGQIFKTFRSIVIMGVLDDDNDGATKLIKQAIGEDNVRRAYEDPNYTIAIHRDRWANGQTVVYWFAPTRSALLKTVAEDYQRVMNQFNEADTKLFIQQLYAAGQNVNASESILELFDLSLQIPRDYVVANVDSVSMWLRKETDKTSSNIFIYSLPISDSTQPNPERHKYIRDKLTQQYFSTHIEDSYMRIDDRYLPIYYQTMTFDGKPTLQARGLWGMVNDFMGGSFVSYMMLDEAHNRVLFLDGFVHAPGQKKRPEMRRLDMIFSTLAVQ